MTGSGRQRTVRSDRSGRSGFPRRRRSRLPRRSRRASWNGCCETIPARERPSTSSSSRDGSAWRPPASASFSTGSSSFGLIEKRPNAGWVFKGFTTSFALELFEIREMFELRSALAFAALPEDSPLWRQIETLREEHLALLEEIECRYHDFSDLDSRFHRLINSAVPNRFIDGFYDIITLDLPLSLPVEQARRTATQRGRDLREHLAYIDALLSRDAASVRRACRAHLASAKTTLIDSTSQQRPRHRGRGVERRCPCRPKRRHNPPAAAPPRLRPVGPTRRLTSRSPDGISRACLGASAPAKFFPGSPPFSGRRQPGCAFCAP